MKKRVLVVPHFPLAPDLLTRGEALAQGLARVGARAGSGSTAPGTGGDGGPGPARGDAGELEVHLVSWHLGRGDRGSRFARAAARLAALARPRRVFRKDLITVIETPLAFVRSPALRFLVSPLNTAILNRIIADYRIDAVINELSLVDSLKLARPYFIDIVDLPAPGDLERWGRQAARAKGVITITDGLRRRLAPYGIDAEVIGNGADVERFRRARGEAVRRTLRLDDKFTIGYIGNHAEWSGLQFLLDVFKAVKSCLPEAALLVVGPGTEVPAARARCARENIQGVVFTGPVPLDAVPDYFAAADVAVLPFELDPHAALSFPIKVIESSAARKIVVASPVEVLKDLALPNVRITERRVETWAHALLEARNERWSAEWDPVIDRYDWRRLASALGRLVLARL